MKDPIPLSNACLCLDCDHIGDDHHRCQCGSSHLLRLATVLDREAPRTDPQLRYLITMLDASLAEFYAPDGV